LSNFEDPQSQTDRHLATAHRFDAAGVAERYASLAEARQHFLTASGVSSEGCGVDFVRQDVMATDFDDDSFDAVICNRLLHHYPTPELRRRALAELRRVSRGVVLVSYFSNMALSAFRFHVGKALQGRTPTDRVPIWFSALESDLDQAGLVVVSKYPVRYGLSPQTYLRLRTG
jgi:SAM-dependent methyltransferase